MRHPTKVLLAIFATAALVARAGDSSSDSDLVARVPQPVPEFTVPQYLRPRHDDDNESSHGAPNMSTPSKTTVHSPGSSHEHGHGHGQPKTELNETAILEKFGPDSLSYYSHDFESEEDDQGHGGLMIFHIGMMSLAFFIVLPLSIVLRSAKHKAHGTVYVVFLAMTLLGFISGTAYKKLSPNLYKGSVHGSVGYVLLLMVNVLTAIDALPLIRRFYEFVRAGSSEWTPRQFWNLVSCGREQKPERRWMDDNEEEIKLTTDHEEHSPVEMSDPGHAQRVHGGLTRFHDAPSVWVNQGESSLTSTHAHGSPSSRYSIGSEATLHDLGSPTRSWPLFSSPKLDMHHVVTKKGWRGRLACAGNWTFNAAERTMIPFAWGVAMIGGCVYTGICRGNYLNGCLAHFIKGSIFFWYGMLTWGRYLGAWSDRGWAWNRTTTRRVSAEMVESFVIFLYGSTNTWMERFGAHAGDPYTTKQIQHISIAVMFWFAGLVGMALESRTIRRLLSNNSLIVNTRASNQPVTEPPSYTGSFNPFPALVIGITGAAMSAHHQNYLFQVQVHALWGNLLTAFAVMRCLTYFFVWLRPARSILPSRPPTEAVASFFLSAGGLVFISSSEPITFAAMRSGRDDIMMFLNAIVAIVCLAYAINVALLTIKGWAMTRGELANPAPNQELA